MTFNPTALIDDVIETQKKIAKSYDTLKAIEEIDIATAPKELVWQDGKIKLYRYKRETPATIKTPILISYALVNTYKMMDIQPDRSFIRNLLNLGADIYLADWGYPTQADKYVTMDDYINEYIMDMVNFIKAKHKIDKINLLGICQGGTLVTIFSALYPELVKNLITLVTPIDFSKNDGLLFRWSRDMDINKLVDYYGVIPGEFLNQAFAMLKPMINTGKFLTVLNSVQDKERLMNFLRMEKWINDSPNQAGECYRQFIIDLYQKNKLFNGELEIGGKNVNLKNISMPLLNIYAEEDHLVPPSATIPLNEAVGTTDKTLYNFKGGHIGVFVGSRSLKELAPAVCEWLTKRDK
jgi:polyhydroxyalkanoate synthase